MAKRALGVVVRLEPVGRLPLERGHEAGLLLLELRAQQLPERPVVAEPVSVAADGDEEQARLQRGEHGRRVAASEDCVAEWGREHVERRRPAEELSLALRQRCQVRLVEVAGIRGVVLVQRDRRGLEPRRPAFERLQEPLDALLGEVHAGPAQDGPRLSRRECEVIAAEFEHLPARAQARDRREWLLPAGEHDRRAGGQAADEHRDDPGGVRGQELRVVEDEHERLGGEHAAREARDGRSPRPRVRRVGSAGGHVRGERRCGLHDARDERGSVGDTGVESDEGERPVVAGGPLCEQGRLPVATRSDDARDGERACRPKAIDEPGPGDHARPARLDERRPTGRSRRFDGDTRALEGMEPFLSREPSGSWLDLPAPAFLPAAHGCGVSASPDLDGRVAPQPNCGFSTVLRCGQHHSGLEAKSAGPASLIRFG